MTALDQIVCLSLSVVLIVGAYQFYFWAQRSSQHRAATLRAKYDQRIPLQVGWVWIYSGLYYPVIILAALGAPSLREFTYTAFSYLVLLLCQMVFFLSFPVKAPSTWREAPLGDSLSARFLAFVRRFDQSANAFPSMHVSVATLTALHLSRIYHLGNPILPVSFVALIALSCLFTKQHYLVDLPPGVLLGWVNYRIFDHLFRL